MRWAYPCMNCSYRRTNRLGPKPGAGDSIHHLEQGAYANAGTSDGLTMTRQHDKTDFRITWRMANWWQSLITLFFAGGVGWIIQGGLRSTSPDVYGHILVPLYGLALYWTLAALVNRRSVTVTREQLRVANTPLPLGEPGVRVARSDVEFVFHVPLEVADDSGGTVVLFHTVGVAVKPDHTAIPVFDAVPTLEEAQAKAQRIADAFGPHANGRPMEVRDVVKGREDPQVWRQSKIWGVLIGLALVAGIVWEVLLRYAQ